MELIVSRHFKKQVRALAENKPNLKGKINSCLIDFSEKGRKSKYHRKRLKGDLFGYEELQVGGDIRILIRIHDSKDIAVLEQIGTHSQLGL